MVWRFVRSLVLHFFAYTFQIVKTYILLRFLLGDGAPGLAEASMIAIAVSALDQVFFFVPGRLGTLEGARFVVLSALGIADIYGLAFGLIARAEQLTRLEWYRTTRVCTLSSGQNGWPQPFRRRDVFRTTLHGEERVAYAAPEKP